MKRDELSYIWELEPVIYLHAILPELAKIAMEDEGREERREWTSLVSLLIWVVTVSVLWEPEVGVTWLYEVEVSWDGGPSFETWCT